MKKSVVMIGDSITAGFDTKRYFLEDIIINYGVSGDSTVECLERINKEWFNTQPEAIFLCIGTNDLARERTDDFILANIQNIVGSIRHFAGGSTIYITSIFPTRENEPRPNERINKLNNKIEQQSVELGCTFFNLHEHFTDALGMLRKEFTDDGLHLTDEGYSQWSNVLTKLM
jgi:lysophospholipase L1-like esterase